ncbi:uncharacterized, partial [Tachysurus ichikawai]
LTGLWQGQWRLCERDGRSHSFYRPKGTAMELTESEERQQTCLAPSITSSGFRHGVAAHFTMEVVLMPLNFFLCLSPGTTQRCGSK